jgi:hypothetical protein
VTATVAKLFDQRTAPRHPVNVDGTLRDVANHPHEISVADLSQTGFRIPGTADLAVFSRIGLGLTGLGGRSAQVVRRDEQGWYGCMFDVPLTVSELSVVLSQRPSPNVVPLPWFPDPILDAPSEPYGSLSIRTKALIITLIAIVLWGGLSSIVWLIA